MNVERFQDYVDDLDVVVVSAKVRHPGATFLLGHSMGGLIAADYATQHQARLTGLVLSGPAVMPRRVSPMLNLVARVLARIAPAIGVLKLPLDAISRDPEVVRSYQADPLVHAVPMRARQAVQSADAQTRLEPMLGSITIPVLAMHGAADRIVDPASTAFLQARVGSADRTVKIYEGLYHEILNEPEQEVVLADLRAWLAEHRGAGAAARP